MLTIEPNWSAFFTGESVTLMCDMQEGEDTDWHYTILKEGQQFLPYNTNKSYKIHPLTTGHSGEYQCLGYHKTFTYFTKKSNKVSLTVSGKHCHDQVY